MQETICTCKENYNGETKWNAGIEWVEDSGVKGISEPSRHLKRNPMLTLTWNVLMAAPSNDWVRKNLEALITGLCRP